jgi:hypothetical protein
MTTPLTVSKVTVSRSLTIHARFAPHGWATFVIDDTQGTLSITSDWGDWAYRWGRGSNLGVSSHDLSEALRTRFGHDYVASKLLAGNTWVFDEDASRRRVRERLLRMRRERALSSEDAREAWNAIESEFESVDQLVGIARDCDPLNDALDHQPWEYVGHVTSPRYLVLRDTLLPVLRKALVDGVGSSTAEVGAGGPS